MAAAKRSLMQDHARAATRKHMRSVIYPSRGSITPARQPAWQGGSSSAAVPAAAAQDEMAWRPSRVFDEREEYPERAVPGPPVGEAPSPSEGPGPRAHLQTPAR
jgi:hypothetical protein